MIGFAASVVSCLPILFIWCSTPGGSFAEGAAVSFKICHLTAATPTSYRNPFVLMPFLALKATMAHICLFYPHCEKTRRNRTVLQELCQCLHKKLAESRRSPHWYFRERWTSPTFWAKKSWQNYLGSTYYWVGPVQFSLLNHICQRLPTFPYKPRHRWIGGLCITVWAMDELWWSRCIAWILSICK